MLVAAHPVFRTEESCQSDSRSIVEQVYRRAQLVVYPGGVCDKPNALALQYLEATVLQHLDASLDLDFVSLCRHTSAQGKRDGQQ